MADVKFSELTELTTPASADILAVVDTSASTSKKLTINSLFGAVPVDVRIDDATDTSSTTTGSIQTDGGIGVAKGLHVGLASNLVGAVTIGTGLVPDASDGAYLGTSSLEFSDIFLADGAVISLGDGGADVTLTHVADTGVQVNDTNKIMFHDASQFIQGVSATVLGLGATDEIDLTATTIDVNGILNVSGAVVPAASDGAALGSASLEWSDLFLADAGVINFGADQDVTLTHVADTGLMLNAAMQLRFRDSAILIGSSQDGQLDIDADTEVEITTTTLDLNGALDVSTTTTLAGVVTVNTGIIPDADDGAYLGTTALQFSDLFLADAAVINLGDDQDVTLTHVADTGVLLNSDNVIQFRDTGLTIGSSADGTLDVVADTILDLDAATVTLTKAGADQVIKHATDAYDLVFQQYDADEVARIHDGAKSVVTNLEATAAGKGGFGFKRPVYKSTPGSDDETVALTAAHSGCLVQVVGAAYDMDYTLPAIASGDEGWHITFVVTNAFSGTNNLEIRTNGASADDNDAIHLYKNTAGTTAVDVDGGDVLRSAADIPAGTMIRLTCVLGGAAEVWIAEWMQPSGSAPTTETAVA